MVSDFAGVNCTACQWLSKRLTQLLQRSGERSAIAVADRRVWAAGSSPGHHTVGNRAAASELNEIAIAVACDENQVECSASGNRVGGNAYQNSLTFRGATYSCS
jgi:hypothetical protein